MDPGAIGDIVEVVEAETCLTPVVEAEATTALVASAIAVECAAASVGELGADSSVSLVVSSGVPCVALSTELTASRILEIRLSDPCRP